MKKLCFVLALVLMLSSLCVAPVFAANSNVNIGAFTTGEDFTIFDDDGSKRISTAGFDKYSTETTGLKQTAASAAPQKISGDVAHHVSGTSTLTFPDTWKYRYAGTKVASAAGSDPKAQNRAHYIISFDLYRTIDKPICLRYGFIKGNSTEIHFGNIGTDDLANLKRNRVNDTVTNKWQNIVVDTEIKLGTGASADGWITKVYVDGVPQKITNSAGTEVDTASGIITTTDTDTTKISVFNSTGLTTLFTAVGTKYDFYFDNFKAVASDNAYVPDAAAKIDGADATTGAVTYAPGTKASAVTATNAASVEIYRAIAVGNATRYDIISGDAEIKNNDIIKLTTANGVYSYYTVKVGGGVPFAIGNLTAPASSPVKGSQISASLALSGETADKEVTLILALYRGITLCDIETATIARDDAVPDNLTVSATVPSLDGNYTAKAFVWENANSMIQYK